MIIRATVKTVADFTGMVQARHPKELGGAFWLFNLMYTQASVFVVLFVRSNSNVSDEDRVLKQSELWTIASILLGLWVLSIVLLLKFSVKRFRHTFYQPMRGVDFGR